jgi:UDP-glucose 4-epimerase
MKKKILLTGSNGFIGKHFIKIISGKYEIINFSFQNNNLNDFDLLDIDVVIHLSALVHQMNGASKEEYFKINVENTFLLAQKAKKSGVRHFIFMSTVKVYGEENEVPYSEKTECNPLDDYGKSKLQAENKLRELETESFKISIIRSPIVYGYGVKANIRNLINLVDRIPILPFGKINNKRSMVYVGNLCYMIEVIINKQLSGIFLAADDEPISTTCLIELIARELGKKVILIKFPFFEMFLKYFKPSLHKRLFCNLIVENSETKKKLNFKNPYNVEEGIKYMIHGEE